jgi:lipopolysaccharide transport system ATP-binding protein
VRGRVSALLELGSGFHPDLSGRDNVFLNGSLLGLGRAEMLRRIDDIVDFAELGPFIDTPVKHYSSGMYMRLGFAIATAVDPDILITDEVLAVGDETFQRKCMDRIHAFREEGRTILFVSHALGQVRDLCSQVVWLDEGRVAAAGDTQTVIDAYLRWANEKDRERIVEERAANGSDELGADADGATGALALADANRWGSGEVRITRVEFLDDRGRPQGVFQTGARFVMRMHYEAHTPIPQPVFGVAIYHRNGLQINGPNNRFGGFEIPQIAGRGYVDYVVDELPLLAGEYMVTAAVYDHAMLHAYDHRDRQFPLTVHTDRIAEQFGTVLIPSHWGWREESSTVHSRAVAAHS